MELGTAGAHPWLYPRLDPSPLFFLGVTELWIPSCCCSRIPLSQRSLCSLQPAGAEPLEISDTENLCLNFQTRFHLSHLQNTPAAAAAPCTWKPWGKLCCSCWQRADLCCAGSCPQHFLSCWSKWLFHCSFPGFCFSYRLENALLATLALKQPHAAGSSWPWCSCSAQLSCSSSECSLARVFNKKKKGKKKSIKY